MGRSSGEGFDADDEKKTRTRIYDATQEMEKMKDAAPRREENQRE